MMMPEQLPEDLLEEILCRVPATSLNRLRYTCKRWNLLFNDMRFTRKYFHKAPKQSLILMFKTFGVSFISINLHKDSPIEVTGEVNLIDPHSSLGQFTNYPYYYHSSDGLLLCVMSINNKLQDTSLVVWNPCTGQTKWIQHRKIGNSDTTYTYALGSCQDNKSGNKNYKILSRRRHSSDRYGEFEVNDINSNSWRFLDFTVDCTFMYNKNVSLKGKTYWIAKDEQDGMRDLFLISFDYTTETFERQGTLPYPHPSFGNAYLSVVREEKLVFIQHIVPSKTKIWVTNNISETKVLSWIKVFTVDLNTEFHYFLDLLLVDEEKKVVVYTQKKYKGQNQTQTMVRIVGEDNKVREVAFGDEFKPFLFNYVPSLTQIQ